MINKYAALSLSTLLLLTGQAVAGTKIGHNPAACSSDKGPAVLIKISNIKNATGNIRIQSYPATKDAWLEKGQWINRIELPAKGENMEVCMPLPMSGNYGIAIRHDRNGNGKTDFSKDGGGFSNNPSLNIFNLGKPSYRKVGFHAGEGVTRISIELKYL